MSKPKRHIPRNRNSVEFVREIRMLKERGYSAHQIAERANCCDAYVQSVFYLLKHGDPRLIAEIERGRIPHTIAMHIARAKDPRIQTILIEGYRTGTINTAQIIAMRRRIDEYERENSNRSRRGDAVSIIRIFSKETDKQKLLIRKAKLAKSRLVFIVDAFKQLLSDERFRALLRAEGIHTMPSWLVERIKGSERCSIGLAQKLSRS